MPAPPKPSIRADLESAERFAQRYPAIAGALGLASVEPSLERVREVLFYLGAVVGEEIREFESEACGALVDAIAPDVARPFPAATIVELSTDGPACKVVAGAEFETRWTPGAPAAPPACRFRLVSDVDVGAWRVSNTLVERGARGEDALVFDLVATGERSLAAAVAPRPIRLYVDGPREPALLVVSHVLAHALRVEIEVGGAVAVAGPAIAYGLHADDALAPEPDGPLSGAAFLREYFVFPQKFAFFGLDGVSAALAGTTARTCTVRIRFDAPLPGRVSLAKDALRAHCAPAVNLFPATSEPRLVGPAGFAFPVRVAGHSRSDGGVYAILGASASARDGSAGAVRVPPLRRFAAATLSPSFPYAFSTRLTRADGAGRVGALDGGGGNAGADRAAGADADDAPADPNVVVSLTAPRGAPPVLTPHVVSLDLLATNRSRGQDVRPGELCERGVGVPMGVRVRNIVNTSRYVAAPVGPEFALKGAVRGATPRADALFGLKSLLFALVPRHGAHEAEVRACIARIDAIERLEVTVEAIRPTDHAAPTLASPMRRGYLARFTIDESPFDGLGDLSLFLRVLHRTLDAHASINHTYRCEAVASKSAVRLAWPPRVS